MLLVQVLYLATETQVWFHFVVKDDIHVVEVQISSRVSNLFGIAFGLNIVEYF